MNSQKIALFGAPGEAIQRIATEALKRGHYVTVIVLDERAFTVTKHPNLSVVKGDARRKEDVSKFAEGHDVVICTYEPAKIKPKEHVETTRSLIEGMKDSGVYRLVVAAHPFVQPKGKEQEVYNEFEPVIRAQQEALKILSNEDLLLWTYAHSVEPEAAEETGKYFSFNEIFFANLEGKSRVKLNKYTSAVIDEAEKGEMEFYQEGLWDDDEMEY